jgi:hypothetical protein
MGGRSGHSGRLQVACTGRLQQPEAGKMGEKRPGGAQSGISRALSTGPAGEHREELSAGQHSLLPRA